MAHVVRRQIFCSAVGDLAQQVHCALAEGCHLDVYTGALGLLAPRDALHTIMGRNEQWVEGNTFIAEQKADVALTLTGQGNISNIYALTRKRTAADHALVKPLAPASAPASKLHCCQAERWCGPVPAAGRRRIAAQ